MGFCPKKYAHGFFHDFLTPWARLCQAFGRKPRKCTYRESVAMLAQASGLRYVGSTSISYPKQLIKEMIQFQRGYKIYTDIGKERAYEPMPQGWEMRSLREFQKLSRTHLRRLTYIMMFKLAMQMNLQITLFIIDYMRRHDENFLKRLAEREIHAQEVTGLISILSLMLSFITELYDCYLVLQTFFQVREAVQERVFSIDDQEHYAYDDFQSDETQQNERRTYKGKDLIEEYEAARCDVILMLALVLFCTWLVGYAILKFSWASYCERGAWELASGCFKIKGLETEI